MTIQQCLSHSNLGKKSIPNMAANITYKQYMRTSEQHVRDPKSVAYAAFCNVGSRVPVNAF